MCVCVCVCVCVCFEGSEGEALIAGEIWEWSGGRYVGMWNGIDALRVAGSVGDLLLNSANIGANPEQLIP